MQHKATAKQYMYGAIGNDAHEVRNHTARVAKHLDEQQGDLYSCVAQQYDAQRWRRCMFAHTDSNSTGAKQQRSDLLHPQVGSRAWHGAFAGQQLSWEPKRCATDDNADESGNC